MLFRFYPLRFEFIAVEPISFPPGKAANMLRGALGIVFRQTVCIPSCQSARTCPLEGSCPYSQVFEPAARAFEPPGPSGHADWPRPFVFRARHLDGVTVAGGKPFWFGINVFSLDSAILCHFARTFASLASEGLGPARAKAELQSVTTGGKSLDWENCVSTGLQPAAIPLTPAPGNTGRITVRFLTPTELKHDGKIAPLPEFPILFARIRDRIALLSRLYAQTELAIDYIGTNRRSAEVKMTACSIRQCATRRRSAKTGQIHPIGGFIGEAEYEGDLAEFLPYLEAARWTGVGRQAVWGKGEISLDPRFS